jgi:hypothetical protein
VALAIELKISMKTCHCGSTISNVFALLKLYFKAVFDDVLARLLP